MTGITQTACDDSRQWASQYPNWAEAPPNTTIGGTFGDASRGGGIRALTGGGRVLTGASVAAFTGTVAGGASAGCQQSAVRLNKEQSPTPPHYSSMVTSRNVIPTEPVGLRLPEFPNATAIKAPRRPGSCEGHRAADAAHRGHHRDGGAKFIGRLRGPTRCPFASVGRPRPLLPDQRHLHRRLPSPAPATARQRTRHADPYSIEPRIRDQRR
jgi:hypothetical protein